MRTAPTSGPQSEPTPPRNANRMTLKERIGSKANPGNTKLM